MKPATIILLTSDPVLESTATEAVMRSRHGLRIARNPKQALHLLEEGLEDVELIIIDLDHDMRGLVLLNAAELCCELIPIITVTSLEPSYAAPVASAHGAVACLGKPVDRETLTSAIRKHVGAPAQFLVPA